VYRIGARSTISSVDMACTADLRTVGLLLDPGAGIDAGDEHSSSTLLVFAVRWGRREVVAFPLERGADPNRAGARPVGNAAEVQRGDA
jgi:hypothetical protein